MDTDPGADDTEQADDRDATSGDGYTTINDVVDELQRMQNSRQY